MRWLVGALEMRRTHPTGGPSRFVPVRIAAHHGASPTAAVRHCRKCWAFAQGPKRWRGALSNGRYLKGQSTGGDAEQTSNTARGTPENLADLRFTRRSAQARRRADFDKPRCREASRSVGPLRARRSARPRSYRGSALVETTACPGPIKNTGDESRLLLIPSPEGEGGE
jgi:hypothetical protein